MAKKTVKLVTIITSLFGQKVNLPIAGVVEISKDGAIEVSEETAQQLIEGSSDWKLESPLDNDGAEDDDDDNDDDDSVEVDEVELDKELTKLLIKKFNEDELKSIAKENQLSKTVISKAKSKADLVKMIVNKLSTPDKLELMKANN